MDLHTGNMRSTCLENIYHGIQISEGIFELQSCRNLLREQVHFSYPALYFEQITLASIS